MAAVDITEFERLVNNSRLNEKRKQSIIKYTHYIINANSGIECGFISDKSFLKKVEITLNRQDTEICALLTSHTKLGKLISISELSNQYKLYAINYIIRTINTNKGKNSDFVNNEDFLRTIEDILNCNKLDLEIYTRLTNYIEKCVKFTKLTSNSKLGKLISDSKLDIEYKLLIIDDIIHVMNTNKETEFSFFNNEGLLKAVEIISNSSMQEDMKYLCIMSTILCLKDNNEQQKNLA